MVNAEYKSAQARLAGLGAGEDMEVTYQLADGESVQVVQKIVFSF